MIMALSLVTTTALHAKEPKPDVGAGHVTWFDITTTDMAKSKDFYSKLFGWQFTAVEGSDRAVEIVAGTTPVGTLRVAGGKASAFNGVVYIQVNDMVASCKKVKELGGKVEEGFPFNLSGNGGAVGLAYDPTGHPIGLYSRTSLPAAPTTTPATTTPAPAKTK
jgi:predicted enzyme related to lactoylglutathione lyase